MGKASTQAVLASWALAGVVAAYLFARGTGVYSFLTLTDRTSWAWEITSIGFFLNRAQDQKNNVAGFYWAKALVVTGIASFGGGFLAPLVVGHVPVPLMEETFVWMLIFAWYVTHHVPLLSDALAELMATDVSKVLFSVFFSIFRTQQIVGNLELAAKAVAAEELLPHSAYFPVSIAAPLVCGFFGGCGGLFLPLSNGLQPIEQGKAWPVRAAVIATLSYFIATRGFGCDMLDAKLGICLFRIIGENFPGPRDAVLNPLTSTLYKGTRLRHTQLPVVVPVSK